MPAAVDLLRSLRVDREEEKAEMLLLAATDPANPYGALLRWPASGDPESSLTRSVGARVILWNGALAAYVRRGNPNMQVFLPDEEPGRGQMSRALAKFLVDRVREDRGEEDAGRAGMLISTVNGIPVAESGIAKELLDAGFIAGAMGFHVRRASHAMDMHRMDVKTHA